ncbi:hypothetical protein M8C21_000951, partial [Ambrosia artemisiifolia]
SSLSPNNSTTTTDNNNNNTKNISNNNNNSNNKNNSSSPVSITTTTSLSSNSNIKKSIGCDYYQPVVLPTEAKTPPVRTTGRTNKKMKTENSPPASHAK